MAEVSPEERDMLIRTLIGEAGSENDMGRAAVAHVILNRMEAGRYGGKTAKGVILKPWAFEPWMTKPEELMKYKEGTPEWNKAAEAADRVLSGEVPDITNGATHFLSPGAMIARNQSFPSWANPKTQVNRIGRHVFYAPEGRIERATETSSDRTVGTSSDLLDAYPAELPQTPAPALAQPKPVDILDAYKTEDPVPAAPQLTLAPLPKIAPKGALAASPDDTWASSAGKGAATAAIQGVGDIVGLPGNMRELGQTVNGYLQPKLFTPEQIAKAEEARPKGWLRDPIGSLLALAPTGKEVTDPVLEKTGEYVPTSDLGKTAMAAGRAGVGALMTGPSAMLPGAIGGAAAEEVGRMTDNPLLGAAAGILAPGVASGAMNLLTGARSGLTSEQQRLARGLTEAGVDVPVPQMKGGFSQMLYDTMGKLPLAGGAKETAKLNSQFTSAIGELVGIPGGTELTQAVFKAQLKKLGEDIGKITKGANLDASPLNPAGNKLYTVLQDLRNKARDFPDDTQRAIEKLVGSIENTAVKNNFTLPGEAFQELIGADGAISTMAKHGGAAAEAARTMKTALHDFFEASTSPDVAAAYKAARTRYAIAKTIEPEVMAGEVGSLRPQALANKIHKNFGLIDDNNPQAIQILSDLAEGGKKFLKTPGDTNTPIRSLLYGAGGSVVGGAGIAGALSNPAVALATGGKTAAGLATLLAAARAGRLVQNNPLSRRALLYGTPIDQVSANPLINAAAVPYLAGAPQ